MAGHTGGGGGGGFYKLEFLQIKFCTKFLCAICSVLLRICAGTHLTICRCLSEAKQRMLLHKRNVANGKPSPLRNNSKRPLFLVSNYCEPYIICSLISKKLHRFCCARICRFIFSRARNIPPLPSMEEYASVFSYLTWHCSFCLRKGAGGRVEGPHHALVAGSWPWDGRGLIGALGGGQADPGSLGNVRWLCWCGDLKATSGAVWFALRERHCKTLCDCGTIEKC